MEFAFNLFSESLHKVFAALSATILKGLGHMTIEWLPDEMSYYAQNMAALMSHFECKCFSLLLV